MIELLSAQPALAIAGAGILGLFIGSFLNVVILRLPPRLMHAWRAQSREVLELAADGVDRAPDDLVFVRSRCPKCGHKIAAWENVPLLSYVVLRGRCRGCRAPISIQYPLVEVLTGLLSALVVWRFGPGAAALVALVVTWTLIVAAGIDLHTQLLPDQLTLPLLWLGLLCSLTPVFVPPSAAILGAALGYLSLWSVYWAFKLLTGREGMGYGDFKLLAALGAFTGWQGLLPIVLLSSLVGALIGSAWLIARGRDRATPIPFGPFLAAGGWIQLVFGERVLAAWGGLFTT